MTGGGFGGSAIVLAPADRADAVRTAVEPRRSPPAAGPSRDVFEVAPSAGAHRDA